MNHITFEEMKHLAGETNFNKMDMRLAKRVNAHLRICRDCRMEYSAIAEFFDNLNLQNNDLEQGEDLSL